MTLRLNRPAALFALAATAVGAASSCSTPPAGSDGSRLGNVLQPAMAERDSVGRSIVQLEHGRQAHFATCMPPDCPAVTPKTLAVDPPASPRAGSGPASEAAPGIWLSPGERSVVTGAHAPAAQQASSGPSATKVPWVTEVVVTFPSGSAALTAAARAAIDGAAASDGIRRIDIRGRTDNVGPAAANHALARQRAEAVAQHLRTRHPVLAAAVLNIDAHGGCCYATSNDSPEGRARNRRVALAFGRDAADQSLSRTVATRPARNALARPTTLPAKHLNPIPSPSPSTLVFKP